MKKLFHSLATCLALGLVVGSELGWAKAARPDWTLTPPRADGVYKYYVGRAFEESSEVEAWRVAKDFAQEMAIRENFGTETEISATSYESLGQAGIDRRMKELFPKVRLVDFEQIDQWIEKDRKKISTWLLFRYPIKAITAERARLKDDALAGPGQKLQMNEVGEAELRYSTELEVTTTPTGISVFINGERWGVTPLRVRGVLPPGQHHLELNHPQYQGFESQVVLALKQPKIVHHILKRATGVLQIKTSPRSAEIFIDGIKQRRSGPFELLAGPVVKVEVRAPEHETQIQLIELSKDEVRRLHIELTAKRKLAQANKEKLSDEKLRDDFSYLRDSAERVEPLPHQSAWVGSFYAAYSGASAPEPQGLDTLQLGGSLEKRFFSYLGLRAFFSYDFSLSETQASNATHRMAIEGWGGGIGLPIYLTSQPKGFYLMPEVGDISHARLVEPPPGEKASTNAETLEITAARTGLRLGYFDYQKAFDLWAAYHEYDWLKAGKVQTLSVGFGMTIGGGSK